MGNDREAVDRLKGVFLDSYFTLDSERRIDSFNSGFLQLIGLRPTERRRVLGSRCFEHLQLGICKDQCIAVECLAKNAAVRREEIHGTTQSGRELILELSAIPLHGEGGLVTGVFVTHRDVTDERRLKERYLQEVASHLKERDSLLGIIKERGEEIEALKRRLRGQ